MRDRDDLKLEMDATDQDLDEGFAEDDPFYLQELDFELEVALERFGTLKSADRILRAKEGMEGAAALIFRRHQPVH